MITARTARNPAAAKRPTPMPPALTLTLSSDLASSISLEIRVEMSRLASVTRLPMVGSVSFTGSCAMRGSLVRRLGGGSGGAVERHALRSVGAGPTTRPGAPGVGRVAGGEPGSLVGTPSATPDGVSILTDPRAAPVSVVRRPRFLPDLDEGESTFLGALLRKETVGGAIALLAAAVAVVWANSPFADSYTAFAHLEVGPLDMEHWAADGALTLFFF